MLECNDCNLLYHGVEPVEELFFTVWDLWKKEDILRRTHGNIFSWANEICN